MIEDGRIDDNIVHLNLVLINILGSTLNLKLYFIYKNYIFNFENAFSFYALISNDRNYSLLIFDFREKRMFKSFPQINGNSKDELPWESLNLFPFCKLVPSDLKKINQITTKLHNMSFTNCNVLCKSIATLTD